MRHLLITLLFLVSGCAPVIPLVSTPTFDAVRKPVHIDIPGASLSFPLEPRPLGGSPEQGVPYVSGPAFWQQNGWSVDVSSHCTERPGMDFDQISMGDKVIITYDSGATYEISVVEIIFITYESQAEPLHYDWIDQNGKHYTYGEFIDYTVHRYGSLMLHTSRCTMGVSTGQAFYIAN